MLPVSPAWGEAILRPHRIVAFAVANFDGGPDVGLPITEAVVSIDANSEARRSLSATIAGIEFMPTRPDSPLAANGQRIKVWRGVEYVDGSTEIKPLGTFRIESWEANPITGPVTVQALSLECLLNDDRFEAPRTISGPSIQTKVRELCAETAPDVDLVITATSDSVCPVFVAEEDRLGTIRELAKAIGADFRADAYGRYELRDVPTITDPVAWQIDAATVTESTTPN
jgi:hypothetical protein